MLVRVQTGEGEMAAGRDLAGPAPVGAKVIGTIYRDGQLTGAAVELPSGVVVECRRGQCLGIPPECQPVRTRRAVATAAVFPSPRRSLAC